MKDRSMKRWWLGVLMAAVASASYVPEDAFAKRLGGGRPAGMQRQMPAQNQSTQATPNPAAPTGMQQAPAQAPMAGAAAGAAANAGKRSWMGPLAGLAAGIGLAALFSHFGLGEGLANFVMVLMLAAVAFFAIRWIMGRMGSKSTSGGLRPSYAGASAGSGSLGSMPSRESAAAPLQRTDHSASVASAAPAAGGFVSAAQSFQPASQATSPVSLPAGFDSAGFERIAKMIFIRLQAANDAGNLNDLRQFTTPEMFAAIRLDLQERGDRSQQTDVEELHAQVLHADQEAERLVVSVRFHGRIQEEAAKGAEPFDEIWHLVRQQGQDAWLIAGIQPAQPY